LDANLPLDEMITITEDDKDTLRYSRSRLLIGKATLSRENMLRVALMSSDNRAAHALGRTAFPGGIPEFVRAMNAKAQSLGMTNSTFADPTGLFAENVSTATDLSKMVRAASQYQLIREITSTGDVMLEPHPGKKPLQYVNTNRLVRSRQSVWNINLSKTGYIREAGKCLVMEATLPSGVYDFVFLNGPNQSAPFTDAERLRKWLEKRAVSAN
ncbi:peptidase S11, partial [Achromatium sp. WMS2]